jgi:hypothetical protein
LNEQKVMRQQLKNSGGLALRGVIQISRTTDN